MAKYKYECIQIDEEKKKTYMNMNTNMSTGV